MIIPADQLDHLSYEKSNSQYAKSSKNNEISHLVALSSLNVSFVIAIKFFMIFYNEN